MTGSSENNLLMVLPCAVDAVLGKAGILGDKVKKFEPILKLASQCLVVKKRNNGECEVVGFFVAWQTSRLRSEDKSEFDFSVLDSEMVEKFPVFVKLICEDRTVDSFVLEQLLEEVDDVCKGVVTNLCGDSEQCNLKCFQNFGFQDLKCESSGNLVWLGKPGGK